MCPELALSSHALWAMPARGAARSSCARPCQGLLRAANVRYQPPAASSLARRAIIAPRRARARALCARTCDSWSLTTRTERGRARACHTRPTPRRRVPRRCLPMCQSAMWKLDGPRGQSRLLWHCCPHLRCGARPMIRGVFTCNPVCAFVFVFALALSAKDRGAA